ncbi:hypothetical protein GS432_16190 [Rhodococcus hoagii]|nr:hypothetical protein [Prescottella equi]
MGGGRWAIDDRIEALCVNGMLAALQQTSSRRRCWRTRPVRLAEKVAATCRPRGRRQRSLTAAVTRGDLEPRRPIWGGDRGVSASVTSSRGLGNLVPALYWQGIDILAIPTRRPRTTTRRSPSPRPTAKSCGAR